MPSRSRTAVLLALFVVGCGDSDSSSAGTGAGTTAVAGGGGGANTLPVAVIRATPPSGVAPLTVDLGGSDSTDADGQIVSYAWSIDHELDVGIQVTHVFDAGCHPIQLSVTDDEGGIGTTETMVAVAEGERDPPPSCE